MQLTDQLKTATRAVHRDAEQSGVIASLLSGAISRDSYALYLRNLAEVYRALEQPTPVISLSDMFYRFPGIANDLSAIVGADWETTLPVVTATEQYCHRINSLMRDNSSQIIAHCYVRYLGDLYGGQIISHRLQKSLGLESQQLSWYQFDSRFSLKQHREVLRAAINGCHLAAGEVTEIIDEALAAFRHNIAVSLELAVS